MSKWVQHISGQGEKWEVGNEISVGARTVGVKAKHGSGYYTLPIDEYRECSPPETWIECTREAVRICNFSATQLVRVAYGAQPAEYCGILNGGYRWAWKGDALVIEKRQP